MPNGSDEHIEYHQCKMNFAYKRLIFILQLDLVVETFVKSDRQFRKLENHLETKLQKQGNHVFLKWKTSKVNQ